jgi:hypothetical protein
MLVIEEGARELLERFRNNEGLIAKELTPDEREAIAAHYEPGRGKKLLEKYGIR